MRISGPPINIHESLPWDTATIEWDANPPDLEHSLNQFGPSVSIQIDSLTCPNFVIQIEARPHQPDDIHFLKNVNQERPVSGEYVY